MWNVDICVYIYIANIPCPKCGSCHRATMVIAVRAHCNPLDIYIYIYSINVYVNVLSRVLQM